MQFLKNVYHKWILIYPLLAAGTTYACIYFDLLLDMKVVASVFFVGIFFCFGIVMNTADERRFKALEDIASIKGNLLTILQIAKSQGLDAQAFEDIRRRVENVIVSIVNMFAGSEESKQKGDLQSVDASMYDLEEVTNILRKNDFPSPEISRIHELFGYIYVSFERLLCIKNYRTPLLLRECLRFSMSMSVFVLAPEFASLGYWGIPFSFLIAFLLSSLMKIQDNIEHPFGDDLDDVKFEFLDSYMRRFRDIADSR